jgi:very-short-patch-repair endonuclease
VLSRRNFPRVLFNVVVGGVEVDAYFPDQGVIVEVDGYQFHSAPRVFESDRRRDRRHLRDGHPTVRLTWRSMMLHLEGEADLLEDVLGRYG